MKNISRFKAPLTGILTYILIIFISGCESFIDPRFLTNVATKPVTNVTIESAQSGGIVKTSVNTGGSIIINAKTEIEISSRGVCWSTSPNPTIADNNTTDGSGQGTFSSNITGLERDLTYYVRAYAVNDAGIIYGNQVVFSTYVQEITAVEIPAGTFVMGSPTNETTRSNDETQHDVTISAFKMSKYEITNQQFAVFLNTNNILGNGKFLTGRYPDQVLIQADSRIGLTFNNILGWSPATGYENHPAINVTWFGADEFARYVGGRLPTEAEWEYAARAGTTTPFSTGECISDTEANYNWKFPYSSCTNFNTTSPEGTHPVGTYPANAWGLHDMHGNVWEWVSDWYGLYPTTPETDPKGPVAGNLKIVRGGSWYLNGLYLRSAIRRSSFPDSHHFTRGFRVAFNN